MDYGYVPLEESAPDDLDVFHGPAADAINAARLAWLFELGLEFGDRRVLDLGCGPGRIAHELVQRGAVLTGVDGRIGVVEAARAAVPDAEFHVADVQRRTLAGLGRFEIVVAIGLLYHLRHPLLALENIAAVCDDVLVLETQVCDSDLPVIANVVEPGSSNQALDGIGSRPSVAWLRLALESVGFVDVEIAAPGAVRHEDFDWRPVDDGSVWRDGHPLRVMLVARRAPQAIGAATVPYALAIGDAPLPPAPTMPMACAAAYRLGGFEGDDRTGEVRIAVDSGDWPSVVAEARRLRINQPALVAIDASFVNLEDVVDEFGDASVALRVDGDCDNGRVHEAITAARARGLAVIDALPSGRTASLVLGRIGAASPIRDWVPLDVASFEPASDGSVAILDGVAQVTTSADPWGYGALLLTDPDAPPSAVRVLAYVEDAPIQIAMLESLSELISAVTLPPADGLQTVALSIPSGRECLGIVIRTAAKPGPGMVRVVGCFERR